MRTRAFENDPAKGVSRLLMNRAKMVLALSRLLPANSISSMCKPSLLHFSTL
jgi:hypothetical protein